MKVTARKSEQHGTGVFAQAPIVTGELILTFTGPLLARREVNQHDYHLQIGDDLYLGSSGREDDYVNHSCDPNSGFTEGLRLVALRPIAPGEEITWDYSTAIDEADFSGFACQCGASSCRGSVHSFRHLDAPTRERLRHTALPYLRDKYR